MQILVMKHKNFSYLISNQQAHATRFINPLTKVTGQARIQILRLNSRALPT